MKPGKTLGAMTIRELVRFYGAANGNDDDAGPEFRKRGTLAREELIGMLDGIPAADLRGQTAETIADILKYQFPSPESSGALERLQSRYRGPLRGSMEVLSLTSLRAQLSGQMNDAWQKQHRALSPVEADLHYTEMLLANARAVGGRRLRLRRRMR